MKNPFEKEDHTGLIVAVAAAAVTAGAIAYLYLTEGGSEARHSIKHKLKDVAKDIASEFISDKTGVEKTTVKKVADHVVK